MKAEVLPVKVGQIWEDCDYRAAGRQIRVIEINGDKATVETTQRARNSFGPTGRKTIISIKRMKPTKSGYRLVADV